MNRGIRDFISYHGLKVDRKTLELTEGVGFVYAKGPDGKVYCLHLEVTDIQDTKSWESVV